MPRRPVQRVLVAWLITGPIGHLVCGLADWWDLLRHWAWSRLRGRDPWAEAFTPR